MQERLSRTGRIGGDARHTSVDEWHLLSTKLQREGLQLVHIPTLLDTLWNEEPDPARRRPDFSKIVAKLHDSEYTGETILTVVFNVELINCTYCDDRTPTHLLFNLFLFWAIYSK